MVILITGASHTGKTLLAQRMLEMYKYPYLSIYILIRVSNPVVLICYEEVLKGAFRQCIYCSILS